MDPNFRQWAASRFPEIYILGGDQGRWDSATAELAFSGYIRALSEGRRKDWWSTISEFKRSTQPLRPGFLASLLRQYWDNDGASGIILQYVLHGAVVDCAAVAEEIFETAPHDSFRFRMSVEVLGKFGTLTQTRKLKRRFLVERAFEGNNSLIAGCLDALGLRAFSQNELVRIIDQTTTEERFGGGAMARGITDLIADEEDVSTAEAVLKAILQRLPPLPKGAGFHPNWEGGPPKLAWLYDALPDAFIRLLELLPPNAAVLECCVRAAEQIEYIRHTEFAKNDELNRLAKLVEAQALLRWALAEAIAQSDHEHNYHRLEQGIIVKLSIADLGEITRRANDSALPKERNAWFEVAQTLIYRNLKANERQAALARLAVGAEAEERQQSIRTTRTKFAIGARSVREFRNSDRKEKSEREAAHREIVERIGSAIESIRRGNTSELISALNYIFSKTSGRYFDKLDFDEVEKRFSVEIASAVYDGLKEYFENNEVQQPIWMDGSIPWSVILLTTFAQEQFKRDAWGARPPIAKLARLDVWFPNGPSEDFKALALGRDVEVAESLFEWVLNEAQTLSAGKGAHSAIKFALNQSPSVKTILLNELRNLPSTDGVRHPSERKGLFDEMADLGVLSIGEQARIAERMVKATIPVDQPVNEFAWFRRWYFSAPDEAWGWLTANLASSHVARQEQLRNLVSALGNLKSKSAFIGAKRVSLLVELYTLLKPHAEASELGNGFDRSSISGMLGRIPGFIREEPLEEASRALAQLVALEDDADTKRWLLSEQFDHASNRVQGASNTAPEQLRAIVDGFESDPNTEGELLAQVVARLEEIRRGVEEGPFSDRSLFNSGMPEKDLQLWLAARLAERTPMRRFTVQREEEVDDDKKTDIQLGTGRGFTVCIEIKPLDSENRYSAAQLVSTLKDQLIGQYLKGHNSAHGILVLFRLEKRTWKVNRRSKQDFEVLLRHLEQQAEALIEEHNKKRNVRLVQVIKIFDIRCFVDLNTGPGSRLH
jgi:hypothetical protein